MSYDLNCFRVLSLHLSLELLFCIDEIILRWLLRSDGKVRKNGGHQAVLKICLPSRIWQCQGISTWTITFCYAGEEHVETFTENMLNEATCALRANPLTILVHDNGRVWNGFGSCHRSNLQIYEVCRKYNGLFSPALYVDVRSCMRGNTDKLIQGFLKYLLHQNVEMACLMQHWVEKA